MTLVSGPLSTVTADPTAVSVVQVSVQGPRTAGTGVQTHESKNVPVSGGVFSHKIAPGPATLTMIVGQQPGPPIPILVDDVESQTLAKAVEAAGLASGETYESLASFVQQVLAARAEVLDAADDVAAEKNTALSSISSARSGALTDIGTAESGALSAISGARGGALTDIGQATSSAVTDIGTAESGALSAIGVEVGKAEDAATRAENAVNDGLGDGAVTVAKLAQDVKDQINGKADLVGGKVPTSQIPEVALTKPFSVTSRAALLALDAQEGDIGIITAGADKGSYMLGTGPATTFSSWVQLAVSADAPVTSVNGQTGTVVLNAANVGAAPTTHTHTSANITDKVPGVWTDSTVDGRVIATSGGGYIQTSKSPVSNTDVTNKIYVDSRISSHTHTMAQITDLPTVTENNVGGAIVQRLSTGQIRVPETPSAGTVAASKAYVDSRTFTIARQEVTGTNGVTIFEKRGNVVHVASAGTNAGVTIPTDFRPTQVRRVAVSTGGAATNVGSCTLNTDGTITGGWAAGAAFSYLAQ